MHGCVWVHVHLSCLICIFIPQLQSCRSQSSMRSVWTGLNILPHLHARMYMWFSMMARGLTTPPISGSNVWGDAIIVWRMRGRVRACALTYTNIPCTTGIEPILTLLNLGWQQGWGLTHHCSVTFIDRRAPLLPPISPLFQPSLPFRLLSEPEVTSTTAVHALLLSFILLYPRIQPAHSTCLSTIHCCALCAFIIKLHLHMYGAGTCVFLPCSLSAWLAAAAFRARDIMLVIDVWFAEKLLVMPFASWVCREAGGAS